MRASLKLLFLAAFSLALSTSCVYSQGTSDIKNGHVDVRLISESQSIQPNHPFWVAIQLKMDPGWHTYWQNPGDSGLATKITWTLTDDLKAEGIQWPLPQKISLPPLMSYGYEGTVLLLTKINALPTLPLGETTLKARVDWLVCADICIPGHADVDISLPVISETSRMNTQWSKDFANTRYNLPLEHSDWIMNVTTDQQTLDLKIIRPKNTEYSLKDIYFYPERSDLINHADAQTVQETENGYEIQIPRSQLFTQRLTRLKGILYSSQGWRGENSEHGLAIDVPVEAFNATANHSPKPVNLILALLFAFIGGLILNLMPCVLPVLSLKILGFVKQSHKHKDQLKIHGLIFTAGVLVSFWILAGLMLILRAIGQNIGWGFQFQSPIFVVALCVLLIIFALNLLGLFEIQLPFQISISHQKQSQWVSTFLSGFLATILATPCSAPFMGTALGFALTQPTIIALAIFTFLGLGMAFPYLLFSFVPPLLKFLPKPGPWMVRFKQLLAIPVLITVLWLFWVLGSLTMTQKETTLSTWQSYSPQLISKLQSEHRIILIDFTARWCLTCQVNERLALENPDVIRRLKELNVATVKADWTKQDENITKALASFGKNSIPLYVLYDADGKLTILPELITPQIILEKLNKEKS